MAAALSSSIGFRAPQQAVTAAPPSFVHLRCDTRGVLAQRPPARRSQGRRLARHTLQAASTGRAVGTEERLQELLDQLMTSHTQLEAQELEARVPAIEEAGAALGWNQVRPELNDGRFAAAALSGRLKKVTGPAAALMLGGLTFGAVQPAALELAFRAGGPPPIFKGPRQGVPNAYTVTTAFSVPAHDLAGICEVAGTYRLDERNPQRLHVTFTEVSLSPEARAGGQATPPAADELSRWEQLLFSANPAASLDPGTGRLSVRLAQPSSVWLDFLVMSPEFQLSRSSLGSVALLRRAGA